MHDRLDYAAAFGSAGSARMRAAAWLPLAVSAVAGAQSAIPTAVPHNFTVFEFRRYIITDGNRDKFAANFDAYFPDAFEQIGAIVVGEALERKNPNGFTWLRGFHTFNDRAIDNALFYYGPVWQEHKKPTNDLLVDNDNVMLLKPLSPEREPMVYPSVDPITGPTGAHGIVVAQIFNVQPHQVDAFARAAESTFARYRAVAGVREAGVLVTLDTTNNFPILPIRKDVPFLVWLGVVKDEATLDHGLQPVVDHAAAALTGTGLLRGAPEWVVMDPTRRSRLRWWDGDHP
jgi:hypothetical protein